MQNIRLLLNRATANFLVIATGLLILSSCKKDKSSNEIEISEVTAGGNVKSFMIDYLPGNQTLTAITLKNQASGSAGTVKVKIAIDTAVSSAGAKMLPTNAYTAPTLEYDVSANSSMPVQLTINRSNLPPDAVYGIGFKIETTSSGTISAAAKSIILKFDLRNKFDGLYRVTGSMVDVAAPTLTGYFPQDVAVTTTNPNQVVFIPKDLGIPGILILSGTSLSYYGSFGPALNFNQSSNQVTSVVNSYGQPASNTRSAEIDPSGVNVWDPATKNIYVKFYQKQPNTVTTPPNIRVYFNLTLTYLGPRF
jgi:hypothetical protein